MLIQDYFQSPVQNKFFKKQTYKAIVESFEVKEDYARLIVSLVDPKPVKKVQLTLSTIESGLFQTGDQISFTASLKKPRSYKNPGVFDYGKYLWRLGIEAVGYIDDVSTIQLLKRTSPNLLQTQIQEFHDKVKNHLGHHSHQNEVGILLALLWGDTELLNEEDEDLFRDAGLSHLLVISGMHFASIAGVIYFLFFYLCRKSAWMLLHWPVRRIVPVATFLFLSVYFLICVKNPSVERAYIAVTLFLFAQFFYHPKDWWNTLFLAGFLILACDPHSLFDLSFQFSFVAVLSLMLIYPRLERLNPFSKTQKILSVFSSLILINITMFIGLTPLIVFHFYRFQYLSTFNNLWAVPLIELLIVPLSLLGLFLFPIWTWAATIIFKLSLLLIHFVLCILYYLQNIFPPPILVFPPHEGELIVYYLLLIILLLKFPKMFKNICLCFALLFVIIDASYWIHRLYFDDHLRITQIDVEQGDSILVELPSRHRILIDAGGARYFDIGEKVLIPFLLYQRIPYLDAVCVTHADRDHYGGFQALIKNYDIGQIWWNGSESTDEAYRALFDEAKKRQVPVRLMAEGNVIDFGDSRFTVLSPGFQEKALEADNAHSIVLKLESAGTSALFTGDIDIEEEMRILARYPNLNASYLKLAHHGSRFSSSVTWLHQINPSLVSIGVGENNSYGHPTPQVLERLQGIPYYRTDIDGAILSIWDGQKWETETFNFH